MVITVFRTAIRESRHEPLTVPVLWTSGNRAIGFCVDIFHPEMIKVARISRESCDHDLCDYLDQFDLLLEESTVEIDKNPNSGEFLKFSDRVLC